MTEEEKSLSRPERKRQQRAQVFIEAAQRIIAAEGFEGLTMSRLAAELDTVVSAVYRYFPSKGALIAAIQEEGIERMSASLTTIVGSGDRHFAAGGLDERGVAVARLVLFGRWLCATTETYPEELRLFQLIMSQRESALDPEGGLRMFPIAMALGGHAVAALDAAEACGAIEAGSSIDRAVIWASGLSGVLETDDLERYAPGLFGKTRLARQANVDLIAGWGASRDAITRGSELVDGLAAIGPLAP